MDPRVERTRAQLQGALFALASERSLDDITIADIADRADVNRSSFYQHYNDKETLLADALEAVLDEVAGPVQASVRPGTQTTMPPELGYYLQHVADNIGLYRRILGEHGSAVVATRLRRRVEAIVRDAVAASAPPTLQGVPLDIVGAGIAGLTLGVITAWALRDPLPPVEVGADWLTRVLRAPGVMLVGDPPGAG